MKHKLGIRQQERTALEVVAFINEKLDLGLPKIKVGRDDGRNYLASWIDLEDSPVGKVFISVCVSSTSLFLHVRVDDPSRFTARPIWGTYNRHSGKFNLHVFRSQFDSFDGFLNYAVMAAEDHVRQVMDHQQEMAA